jgi:very-short-patch-repair endonuclease
MQTPTRTPDDPRFSPIMLRKELIDRGYTDKAIARLVRDGTWARVRHGAYVDGLAWQRADEIGRHELQSRAVLAQAKSDLVLSHLSGAAVWDLSFWDLVPGAVDGTRRDSRAGRAEAGVRQHRGVLLPGDATHRHMLPVVSAERLVIELATVTDLEHCLTFTNELLHLEHTTVERLWARYDQSRHWPHSLNAELLLRLCTHLCESVGESRFLFLCWVMGLPRPICQYKVRDHHGNVVAVVDFAWPELGLFVEFDGKIKYTRLLKEGQRAEDVVVAEKIREDMIRELTGWRCIRIVWADLYQREATALRIRRGFRTTLPLEPRNLSGESFSCQGLQPTTSARFPGQPGNPPEAR